jgi:hypothetical protein
MGVDATLEELRTGIKTLGERMDEVLRRLDASQARITLQDYRGPKCTARAATAYERRHPELLALAVGKVGKRRVYRPADLDAYFKAAK